MKPRDFLLVAATAVSFVGSATATEYPRVVDGWLVYPNNFNSCSMGTKVQHQDETFDVIFSIGDSYHSFQIDVANSKSSANVEAARKPAFLTLETAGKKSTWKGVIAEMKEGAVSTIFAFDAEILSLLSVGAVFELRSDYFNHEAGARALGTQLAALRECIANFQNSKAVASHREYDASWHRLKGWVGEYPNGFTLGADATIKIRAVLRYDTPRSISCLLKKGATYHQWNRKRVVSDDLEFVSMSKIEDYEVKADFTAQLERKLDRRSMRIQFRKGDRWSYLAYLAEGNLLMRFGDVVYVGDQDLVENSSLVSPPLRTTDSKYDEWLKLRCANGAMGWLLAEDVRDAPEFSQPNVLKYGVAADQRTK